MRLLLLRVSVLVEIHYATDRRIRCRCDFDQVQRSRLCQPERVLDFQYAGLTAVGIDYSNLLRPDELVHPYRRLPGWWDAKISTNNAPPRGCCFSAPRHNNAYLHF